VEVVPSLLTVEEAARVLRVGRTKAYAMAQEWRATGGRSGLPVIDFGNVLRVPRCQLEALVGGSLTASAASNEVVDPEASAGPAEGAPHTDPHVMSEQPALDRAPTTVRLADTTDSTTRRPLRRPQLSQSNQPPSLFDSLPD
jgi:hypothetical protein